MALNLSSSLTALYVEYSIWVPTHKLGHSAYYTRERFPLYVRRLVTRSSNRGRVFITFVTRTRMRTRFRDRAPPMDYRRLRYGGCGSCRLASCTRNVCTRVVRPTLMNISGGEHLRLYDWLCAAAVLGDTFWRKCGLHRRARTIIALRVQLERSPTSIRNAVQML